MRDYKNIKAFQLADKLVIEIYRITSVFPKCEIYGLTSQIRRAAVSVPSNIAEGSSRKHVKDYLYFLYIARGSLTETKYLLGLSKKLEYISSEKTKIAESLSEETAKTLYGLINYIEKDCSL